MPQPTQTGPAPDRNEGSDLRDFWDASADQWERARYSSSCYYSRRTRLVFQLIVRHIQGGRALDVGCGTGHLTGLLAGVGFEAYGTDVSSEMVHRANQRAQLVLSSPEKRFRVCTENVVPFDGGFDLITAIGVFPYVPDYEAYLGCLSAQLNPGGVIVASCVNRSSLYTLVEIVRYIPRLRHGRGGWRVLVNLFRTGVWSGGFVDLRQARQCYSAAAFDQLFHDHGFNLVQSLDLYNLSRWNLDRCPLARSPVGQWFARHAGWNHIGVYRKSEAPSASSEKD